MDTSKIAIITTLINKKLYEKSHLLFPENTIRYIIDGTNGMFGIDSIFYMMKKLKGKGIEWLIMADEDVLFLNPNNIFPIIEKMKKEDYLISGVRDGGVVSNRTYSPYLINTFFSIINFKELESIWNKKEILKNQYIDKGEFKENFDELTESYDINSLYEPYYCFYFWLLRKGKKILFLEASKFSDDDDKTTIVYGLDKTILLYHTWYARSYGNNDRHTKRINKIFDLIQFPQNRIFEITYYRDRTFFMRRKILKYRKRIFNRLKILFKKR
jgi:hypothetical protein